MNENNIFEIVQSEISGLCDIPAMPIYGSSDLFELGFDSILVVELIHRLERRFKIALSPEDLFVAPYVSAVVSAVNARLANE